MEIDFKPRFREPLHRTNERIRVPSVRVVTEDGETLGVMDTRDAIQEARRRGLDLVEIAPNAQPPVCKIIDYGKFLYEQKKKAHEAKKKQVTVQVKEIKFRPGTDDHDYDYRMEHAREWLGDGDKVRAAIAFRGREMTHRELGCKDPEEVDGGPGRHGRRRGCSEDGGLSDVHHLRAEEGRSPRSKKRSAPKGREAEPTEPEKKEPKSEAAAKARSRAARRRRDFLSRRAVTTIRIY